MRLSTRPSALIAFLSSCLWAIVAPAFANDHFLIIGGGDSPANNQVSLEKNVVFFQTLLADSASRDASVDVLFSDGNAGSRDVQFIPSEDPPRLNELLAKVFGNDQHFYDQYRRHMLPNVRGRLHARGLMSGSTPPASALASTIGCSSTSPATAGRASKTSITPTSACGANGPCT